MWAAGTGAPSPRSARFKPLGSCLLPSAAAGEQQKEGSSKEQTPRSATEKHGQSALLTAGSPNSPPRYLELPLSPLRWWVHSSFAQQRQYFPLLMHPNTLWGPSLQQPFLLRFFCPYRLPFPRGGMPNPASSPRCTPRAARTGPALQRPAARRRSPCSPAEALYVSKVLRSVLQLHAHVPT